MKQRLGIVVVTIVASVVLAIGGLHLGRWSMQKTWLDERARLEQKLREMAHELSALNNMIRDKRMADKKKREEVRRRMMARRKKPQTKPASGPSTKPGVRTRPKPVAPSRTKTQPARKPPTPKAKTTTTTKPEKRRR